MFKTLACAGAALAIAASASAHPLFDPPAANLPQVAAVPEPASWALMLIGMFGIGVALRRRSHVLG